MTQVYETIRVKDGSIPLLDRHTTRMIDNCRATGLVAPSRLSDEIRAARREESPNERLRVTWDGKHLAIENLPLAPTKPFHVITARIRHGGYRVKTTDRRFFDEARAEALRAGADEALLLTETGYVAEGTLFAVGWLEGPSVCLPSLELGILPSIGRGRVLEVAATLGFHVKEGFFERSVLDGKPVFATTATRGIIKIATLDGNLVPDDDRLERLADNFWPK